MSPVSSALLPPGVRPQTRPLKVPQLNTSSRSRRNPERSADAGVTTTWFSASSFILSRLFSHQSVAMGLIFRQPLLEVPEPLRVDKRLHDPSHFEAGVVAFESPQKPEVDHLRHMLFDLVDRPRFITGVGQK